MKQLVKVTAFCEGDKLIALVEQTKSGLAQRVKYCLDYFKKTQRTDKKAIDTVKYIAQRYAHDSQRN